MSAATNPKPPPARSLAESFPPSRCKLFETLGLRNAVAEVFRRATVRRVDVDLGRNARSIKESVVTEYDGDGAGASVVANVAGLVAKLLEGRPEFSAPEVIVGLLGG